MKLIQVDRPAAQAQWTINFYDGALRVVNNMVETDNPAWIDALYLQGFRPVEETPVEEETSAESSTEAHEEPVAEPQKAPPKAKKERNDGGNN